MMSAAISKAISQLFDPPFRRILGWSLLLTVILFILLGLGMGESLKFVPESSHGWLSWSADIGAWVAFLITAWFVFPVLATAIMGLFLDDAAAAVEARYYPADPPGTALGVGVAFWEAIKLGLVIFLVNILALPLYILALFVPPVGPLLIYYVINGYLLGREYFELVSMRHLPRREAKALRRARAGSMVIYGLPIAFAFSIPLLNLLAPLFGTAYMMHVFKAMRERG